MPATNKVINGSYYFYSYENQDGILKMFGIHDSNIIRRRNWESGFTISLTCTHQLYHWKPSLPASTTQSPFTQQPWTDTWDLSELLRSTAVDD